MVVLLFWLKVIALKVTLGRCFALLFIAASLQLCGCQQQQSPYFGTVEPRHGPEELWINNSSEPEWLDPGRCSDSTGGEIIWNTFEGLVQAHPSGDHLLLFQYLMRVGRTPV
jgi:ABC-type oligopeptide transport system substrate-binding subunit